jgi:two-component system cell cycle sensor histidine kinase/response regulator CckA
VDTVAIQPASKPRTILLVDDDKTITMLLRKMLERHGYCVFSATSAEEALTLFRHRPNEINLLITDVVMPKVSGTELARQVRATQPNIPVLFISGLLPERAVVSEPRLQEAFLQKPITHEQLTAHAYRLLHRDAPPEP